MEGMTEQERRVVKMAVLFELRLRFVYGEKDNYSRQEAAEIIDQIAVEREGESWF